ncbi:hypothetical protein M0R88_07005 [Halorussus gelatinilyticus]|uniref:Uncharacterized protein n=1 Tax=Halorussus gelatinilyticus TaxID=2937524 RepID=A0A8U0IL12_9EURY|nr:hypothetical protein [Halorussus gelatinilyticus]UPW01837.1 hypothetical protein M0R88_07005 [Halorussus gelatinilyticus]
MADSSESPETPDPSDPAIRPPTRDRATLAAKLVGGVQWAITGAYLFLLGFLATGWYLRATRTSVSFDFSRAFAGFAAAAFVAGYLWVRFRPPDPAAHDRRIEVVVTMLVLGFVLPFGVPSALDSAGVELGVPLAGFGVAYAMTLALSYGLVYGLGFRFFLGPHRSERSEFRE